MASKAEADWHADHRADPTAEEDGNEVLQAQLTSLRPSGVTKLTSSISQGVEPARLESSSIAMSFAQSIEAMNRELDQLRAERKSIRDRIQFDAPEL